MAYAQESHLKFMGFELDGTISEFQKKLMSKGLKLHEDNYLQPVGTRAFKGYFSGKEAKILVFYNKRTKEVYRAKAVIDYKDKDIIEEDLNSFKNKLDTKYGSEKRTSKVHEDEYVLRFATHTYTLDNGMIQLYVFSISDDPVNYSLHVDYFDKDNSQKNEASEMDDL